MPGVAILGYQIPGYCSSGMPWPGLRTFMTQAKRPKPGEFVAAKKFDGPKPDCQSRWTGNMFGDVSNTLVSAVLTLSDVV